MRTLGRVQAQTIRQPRARQAQVQNHRRFGYVQERRGFGDGQPQKTAELHHAGFARIAPRQRIQRAIEREHLGRIAVETGRAFDPLLEIDAMRAAFAAALRVLRAGMIDQDAAHGARDQREEMAAIAPIRRASRGQPQEGFVHQREMERLGKEYLDSLSVGDSVVVYVVRPEDRDGNIVLSLSRAQQERDWRDAEALLESGDVFESAVIGFNRGGVICRVGKVRGFIPASQLVTKGEVKGDATEETRYASMVGKTLWLKVVELDRKRNRLILSERLAQRERRRGRKDELLGELKKGDVRKGRISSLAKFGAFVDLGGADGLIHLSELSWSRVNHPNEVIQVGDEVQVYVLNVDRDRKRIGLSLRRLEPEPWSVVHDRYAVGQVVEGIITKLASFGAFARVDGTLEGLIHISELANHRVTHPREVVKEGDVLNLRIIRIDPARRRMGLSLKRAAEEEYAEVDWRAADLDDDDEGADWAVAEE